jgi:hypothetical protein
MTEKSCIRDRSILEPVLKPDFPSTRCVNFLKDNPNDMTFACRIALKLIDKKWYNPRVGEDGPRKEELRLATDEENGKDYHAWVMKHTNDFKGAEDCLAVSTATGANGYTVSLTFALQNDFDGATLQQGLVNYGTLLFLLFRIVAINSYQKYREIKYDEDEQTKQDCSIIITNPPPDATNPKEWRAYIQEKFDILTTACTHAVDNDFLVRSLLERRECMQKGELLFEPGTSLDELNLARIAAQIEQERSFFRKLLACVVPGIPERFGVLDVSQFLHSRLLSRRSNRHQNNAGPDS